MRIQRFTALLLLYSPLRKFYITKLREFSDIVYKIIQPLSLWFIVFIPAAAMSLL